MSFLLRGFLFLFAPLSPALACCLRGGDGEEESFFLV